MSTQPDLAARRVLFLWRNTPTIVLGRNQNVWHECDLKLLEQGNVKLARRMSGGGTVYHDQDNLNLTFLTTRAAYAKETNSRVVSTALQHGWDLPIGLNERGDLTLGAKKISGSAYKLGSKMAFHHCTLLVASDLEALGGLLHPTTRGISTKGIASVKSPVTNLTSHTPGIVAAELDLALAVAFLSEHATESRAGTVAAAPMHPTITTTTNTNSTSATTPLILDIATDRYVGEDATLDARREEMQSWEWVFGQGPSFSFEQAESFEWGHATIRLNMKRGLVVDAMLVLTQGTHGLADAADAQFGAALVGEKFGRRAIVEAIGRLAVPSEQHAEATLVQRELCGWVEESLPTVQAEQS
jgi:lipoate-protein ligase A